MAQIERILENERNTFPENPPIWLMDLATYLNTILEKVHEQDSLFAGKPHGKIKVTNVNSEYDSIGFTTVF